MLTDIKNAYVVENAVDTVDANGTTSSSVQVRPNLETSALAKMLRFRSAHDELLISQLAAADADVKKYLVEHLGQQALGKVPPAEKELIVALRAKSWTKLPRDAETGGLTANFTKPFVSSATFEHATGTEDSSRLDTKLDAFEGGRFSMVGIYFQPQLFLWLTREALPDGSNVPVAPKQHLGGPPLHGAFSPSFQSNRRLNWE